MDFQNWLDLHESYGEYNANNVIVVDVQQTYEDHISFNLTEFAQFLFQMLQKGRRVLYFYNGRETVGHEDARDVSRWLAEKALNLEPNIYEWDDEDDELEREYLKFQQTTQIFQSCQWYDKGYGFFRDWMDEGVEDRKIVKIIRYMYQNRINRSDDIPEEILQELGEDDDLSRMGTIYLPNFTVEMVRHFSGSFLVGGGVTQCLREVQLLMNAFNIRHTVVRKFTF
jgi:hypothetical protein